MAYPNLLDIPGAPKMIKLQAHRIEEFNKQVKAKMRRLENLVDWDGISGARNEDDELLGATTGPLRVSRI